MGQVKKDMERMDREEEGEQLTGTETIDEYFKVGRLREDLREKSREVDSDHKTSSSNLDQSK